MVHASFLIGQLAISATDSSSRVICFKISFICPGILSSSSHDSPNGSVERKLSGITSFNKTVYADSSSSLGLLIFLTTSFSISNPKDEGW